MSKNNAIMYGNKTSRDKDLPSPATLPLGSCVADYSFYTFISIGEKSRQ